MENSILISIVLIVIGVFSRLILPNSSNRFFGYRTLRSLKNNGNWNLANKVSSVCMVISGVIGLLTAAAADYIIPEPYKNKVVVTVLVACLAFSIFFTEKKLKEQERKNSGS